jgi:hypothetical protein
MPVMVRAQMQTYTPTETIEWTWAQAPEKVDAALPNVLIVGDSVPRGYYPETAKLLAGKANVYLFATSASAADARMPKQLADYFAMMPVKFAVVHFTHGLHGWGFNEEEFAKGFPAMVEALRAGAPGAKLIWSSATSQRESKVPATGERSNARIAARNAIALKFVQAAKIPVDDQYALMLAHQDLHSDDVHFTAAGSAVQAGLAAEFIEKALAGK